MIEIKLLENINLEIVEDIYAFNYPSTHPEMVFTDEYRKEWSWRNIRSPEARKRHRDEIRKARSLANTLH